MRFPTRLRVGELRHRIQVVSPKGSLQDSTGGLSLANTSPVATIWAKIEAVSGRDALADQQFIGTVTHKITMRYRGNRQAQQVNILAKDQIYFGNRVFQVQYVANPDERTKMLVIYAIEINDSQQETVTQPSGLL